MKQPDFGADGYCLGVVCPRVTSALVGARTVTQLDNSLDALNNLELTFSALQEIERYAQEGGIDLWKEAREAYLSNKMPGNHADIRI
jgi:hypothetical protein